MDQQAAGDFLDNYRTTFESLDAAAITRAFTFPCQVIGDADAVSVVAVPNAELWRASIDRIVGAYRLLGVASAEIESLQVVTVTPGAALVVVRWGLRRADAGPVYSFTAAYTVVDTDGGPRIAAIVHDEGPKLAGAVAAAGVSG